MYYLRFCESGIWMWLSWEHLAHNVSQGCSHCISQGHCHLKIWWWKNVLAIQVHARSYRQASGLHWMLARDTTRSLPCEVHREAYKMRWFPWEQMRQGRPNEKPKASCNLTSKVTSHNLYHTCRSKSLGPATLKGRELHSRTWKLGGREYWGPP